MGLTPNEILSKEFESKFRGYDIDQVNDFLDVVRVDYEKALDENEIFKRKLADSEEKLEYFAQLQDSLNSSIMVAQDAAERLKQNARKEAELILFEAEREADRVINEASEQAKRIYNENEELKRNSGIYRQRLTQIIESHLSMIQDKEFVELFDSEFADSFVYPKAIEKDQDISTEEVLETEEEPSVQEDVNLQDTLEFKDSLPLSQEELEHLTQHTQTSVLEEEAEEDIQVEKAPETPMESVLGQTIRIDLPK
ncbi:DivIVA domain-containing protein [Fundicoccus sp. Sow4_F4]|uniref:DivIVA domain-containing protein n=1 Tax=Fundicoccus sp. Sow4_F4 TaxID=3438783 RepID=UPI003F9367C2